MGLVVLLAVNVRETRVKRGTGECKEMAGLRSALCKMSGGKTQGKCKHGGRGGKQENGGASPKRANSIEGGKVGRSEYLSSF